MNWYLVEIAGVKKVFPYDKVIHLIQKYVDTIYFLLSLFQFYIGNILIEIFVENFLFDSAQVGPSGNNQQINGEDTGGVPNVVLHRQMQHQQQLHQQQLHLIQQQVIKSKV